MTDITPEQGLIRAELSAALYDQEHCLPCTIRALRLGMVLVESECGAVVGDEIKLLVTFPAAARLFEIPVTVRWREYGHLGLQMGVLGIHATMAITGYMAACREAHSAESSRAVA